jgi:nicotinate-nucleotide adenylyltransferase
MMLLAAAARQLRPHRTLLLPALRSPLKEEPAESFSDRADMLRACAADARVPAGISLFEKRRGVTTYTWQALLHFRGLYPAAEIYFLMGSDCLPGFGRWRRPDSILSSARLLVGRRKGFPAGPAGGYPAVFLKGVFPEVSSTGLRAALYRGDVPREVPPAAARIIKERGLYLGRLRERVLSRLGPGRAAHTLACARLACDIAASRGSDARAAAVAALVHDYAKELDPRRLEKICRSAGLGVPSLEETVRRAPQLLHSWVSAHLARAELGVEDPRVLRAAARHTLGHPSMSELDKTIFVADLAAPDRTFPGAARLRRLALRDLDAAAALGARMKTEWLRRSGRWIHPLGLETCLKLNS